MENANTPVYVRLQGQQSTTPLFLLILILALLLAGIFLYGGVNLGEKIEDYFTPNILGASASNDVQGAYLPRIPER